MVTASKTAERGNTVKKTTKMSMKRAKEKIALLETIINDIRAKYNNTEVPPNSEDSHAVARARGEIDRLIDWRTYGTKEYTSPKPTKEKKERPPRRTAVTEKMGDMIADARKRGMSYAEIAELTGLKYNTVNNWCYRHGLSLERNRKIDPELAIQMRDQWMTYKEIARYFGATKDGVCKACTKWEEQYELSNLSNV